MQVWLQEFTWTEEEKHEKYQKRAADGEVGELLAKEPMFCFGEGTSYPSDQGCHDACMKP
jgi:hypothetical protein